MNQMLNNPTTIVSLSLAAASLVGWVACVLLYLKGRARGGDLLAVVTQLQNELADTGRDVDLSAERATKLADRVAQLEARLASNEAGSAEEVIWQPAARPNITERRHRVLFLERRGQDSATIAATLGMTPGEVELIINLSRAA